MNDVRLEFIDYMRSQGVNPADPSVIHAGEFIRFDLEGERRGKKSGFCIFFDDEFPNGEFGDLRQHAKNNPLKWTPKKNPGRELSEDERRRIADVNRQRAEARRNAILKLQAETAELCQKIWNDAKPADASHPYLREKVVQPHNLRTSRGNLLVPVIKQGKIRSLQFILEKRDEAGKNKFFKRGGEIHGCYCPIGGKPSTKVVVCEGWATGATIFEATGIPVIVAFDAGNLEPVAKYVRAQWPEIELFIACDDDRFTLKPVENPGLKAAIEACSVSNGILRRPVFKSDNGKPTDFNDLAAQCGIDEVKHQIETGRPSFELQNAPEVTQRRSSLALFEPFHHMNGNGRPLATIENIEELLDRMNTTIRYNVINKTDEILIPDAQYSIDNHKNAALARIQSWCNLARIPLANLKTFLIAISDMNLYNPVATWITSKPWDGTSRLDQFYATVRECETFSSDLKKRLIYRWLISAVAVAFKPEGTSAHGVLVFQGAQSVGKTSWFKRLAPAELKVIADGKTLKLDDKDSIYQVISNWIVELGELDATFKKSDIANLKSFITKDKDVIRRPFAQDDSEYARRTVFFASVNKQEFLADDTGNRRYWTIPVDSIDYKHSIDMQQLWAEVYEHFKAGESWYLQPDELEALNASNSTFEMLDPIEERIATFYDWKSEKQWRQITATQVLAETGIDRPTQGELNRVSNAVMKLNGGKRVPRSKEARLLLVPPDPRSDISNLFPPRF